MAIVWIWQESHKQHILCYYSELCILYDTNASTLLVLLQVVTRSSWLQSAGVKIILSVLMTQRKILISGKGETYLLQKLEQRVYMARSKYWEDDLFQNVFEGRKRGWVHTAGGGNIRFNVVCTAACKRGKKKSSYGYFLFQNKGKNGNIWCM